jgi:undecaprenyl-diphosphatase
MTLNRQVFLEINGLAHHSAVLDQFMILCAEYIPFVLAALLLAAWFRGTRHAAFRSAVSGGLGLGAAQLLGLVHYQALPFVLGLGRPLIIHAADNGFPSDHATLCFAVAASLLLSGSRLGPAAILLAALVGFARIFVGVHFPFDVLAGTALGTGVAFVVFVFGRWVDRVADRAVAVQSAVFRRLRGNR